VHIIVTGGGLALDEASWVSAGEDYLFPYLPLSRLFRGKFMAGLASAYRRGVLDLGGDCEGLAAEDVFDAFKNRLYGKEWVVYQKPPFSGPRDVYRYLGRYTHRIAISNHRIEELDETSVRFKTKHGRTVTLGHDEFIRRFLLHVLPKGFVKIRHYGLMAARSKARHERARDLLEATAPIVSQDSPRDDAPQTTSPAPDLGAFDNRCPACLTGTLVSRPLPAHTGRPPPRSSQS
jgi:hypothetical protein